MVPEDASILLSDQTIQTTIAVREPEKPIAHFDMLTTGLWRILQLITMCIVVLIFRVCTFVYLSFESNKSWFVALDLLFVEVFPMLFLLIASMHVWLKRYFCRGSRMPLREEGSTSSSVPTTQ